MLCGCDHTLRQGEDLPSTQWEELAPHSLSWLLQLWCWEGFKQTAALQLAGFLQNPAPRSLGYLWKPLA